MTKTELDTSLMRPADSRAHEECSSLRSPRSRRGTAPVLALELAFRKTNGYEALTVPSGYANWSDRGLTTKVSALRSKLNDVPDSLLCPKHIFFLCSVTAQRIGLADHLKQTVNTVLVGQSFHVSSHSITFRSVQNAIVRGL